MTIWRARRACGKAENISDRQNGLERPKVIGEDSVTLGRVKQMEKEDEVMVGKVKAKKVTICTRKNKTGSESVSPGDGSELRR